VRFDAQYAASLSADAVPALLAVMPKLSEADRCQAAWQLAERWDGKDADRRAWSQGRSRALNEVDARASELAAIRCPAEVAPATEATTTMTTTTTTVATGTETAVTTDPGAATPQPDGAPTISPPAAAPAEPVAGVNARTIPVAPPAPAGARP
jgi:hypothetical protein